MPSTPTAPSPVPEPPAFLARSVGAGDPASPQNRLLAYAWMRLARDADNRLLELFRQGLVRGTVTGGQGAEQLAGPLALLADKSADTLALTHRGLAGHLVWSGRLCDHLNQYLANAASPTLAREGNVHHGDPARRSLPMISHLGAMVSAVLGSAFSQRLLGRPAAGIAFFGDGASSTGDIHEALNLAGTLGIPVLFVIENNHIAYSTPPREQHPPGARLHERAAAYGIPNAFIDTTTAPLSEILTVFSDALAEVRRTGRPRLIEAKILRLRGHAAYDTCDYLSEAEKAAIAAADPLPNFRREVAAAVGEGQVAAVEDGIAAYLEASVRHSLRLPRPSPDSLRPERGAASPVFAPAKPPLFAAPSTGQAAVTPDLERPLRAGGETLTFAQSLNRALRQILATRPEAVLLGQDIAGYGGAFKVSEGLAADFPRPRVLNTPVSESACAGLAIGLALNGHRPILEFQFADFATEAVTQITQNAATMRFRCGAGVPVVFRLPCGGGLTMGSFHSQELESLLLAVPGLKALYPSTPQDARNALLAAYEDDNPVLLFEHKGLYRTLKGTVADDPDYRSVWRPKRLREGRDATLVTYGEMTRHALAAAEWLWAEYEKSVEVFDLRCLAPLNLDAVRGSLARTHRLAVLHEGRLTHGFGAEILARLAADAFHDLDAAPVRIASADLPVPFAPELEAACRPDRDKIIAALLPLLG
ncbi:MAG: transketolase [Opitutaceae bacterium]|jgi:2-oxoisovalerate dehydrogenase E1 component|nr:transketolase [Opitutaceae bacterium]